jgi:hypothetical protein
VTRIRFRESASVLARASRGITPWQRRINLVLAGYDLGMGVFDAMQGEMFPMAVMFLLGALTVGCLVVPLHWYPAAYQKARVVGRVIAVPFGKASTALGLYGMTLRWKVRFRRMGRRFR